MLGFPVWIGIDWSKYRDLSGILDTEAFKAHDQLFSIPRLTKGEMLHSGASKMYDSLCFLLFWFSTPFVGVMQSVWSVSTGSEREPRRDIGLRTATARRASTDSITRPSRGFGCFFTKRPSSLICCPGTCAICLIQRLTCLSRPGIRWEHWLDQVKTFIC